MEELPATSLTTESEYVDNSVNTSASDAGVNHKASAVLREEHSNHKRKLELILNQQHHARSVGNTYTW